MNKNGRLLLVIGIPLLIGVLVPLGVASLAAPGESTASTSGAPSMVAYQGEVQVGGTPYTGDGYFKFAVVLPGKTTATYWSNDGSSKGGSEPKNYVQLKVTDGLFSVLLGNTRISGMTEPLTPDVFGSPSRYLRVWFSQTGIAPFSLLTPDTQIASVPYALQADNADTVDGLHASQLGANYQNVVIVAKSGGDYTSVQAAINSISDAAANNPYLVWVAPGVYDEQVTMKPYVHLQGAGQEATQIISSPSSSNTYPPDEATIKLASYTSLRDLTAKSSGTVTYITSIFASDGVTETKVANVTSQAETPPGTTSTVFPILLYGSNTSVILEHVQAVGDNDGTYSYGLHIDDAQANVQGGSYTARGAENSYGILNEGNLAAEGVTALADNCTEYCGGLYNNNGGSAVLQSGSFTGVGGIYARGIYNGTGESTLTAGNVIASAKDASQYNFGLFSVSGIVRLQGGFFSGSGGLIAQGVRNSSTQLEAVGITAIGADGDDSAGLDNHSEAVLTGGSYTGHGGETPYGIYLYGSSASLEAVGVKALGENGSNNNTGLILNNGASASLHGGSFTGLGGTGARGIYLTNNTGNTLLAEGITARGAEDGTNNRGLYVSNGTVDVAQSVLDGVDYPVYNSGGAVNISNSRLVGGAVSGTVTCVLVTRGTTVSIDGSTCP